MAANGVSNGIETLPTGHTMKEMEGKEGEKMRKNYYCYTDGIMRCYPGEWVLPKTFQKNAHLIHNFGYCDTDVMVTTFPKSGTTWTQEIVWNLTKNPDLENEKANDPLDARFPNFEADMYLATTGTELPDENSEIVQIYRKLCPGEDLSGILIKLTGFSPPPRFIKAHLPLCFFPVDILDRCKMIYVAREIRDVVYSLYHYTRLQVLWGFRGTLDDFVNDFVSDRMMYGPYFKHLKEAWERRNHPNLLFIFYEDMKENIEKEVRKIDQFIGTNRSDKQIQNVIEFTSFGAMKERSKDNPPTSNGLQYYNKEVAEKEGGFFRKGVIGDWRNRFNDEQVKKLNSWAEENLKAFGSDFKYNQPMYQY